MGTETLAAVKAGGKPACNNGRGGRIAGTFAMDDGPAGTDKATAPASRLSDIAADGVTVETVGAGD